MYEETLNLLKNTSLPIPRIAADTGLKLRWLYNVKSGVYDDPGVTKIETLYRYLLNAAA